MQSRYYQVHKTAAPRFEEAFSHVSGGASLASSRTDSHSPEKLVFTIVGGVNPAAKEVLQQFSPSRGP